jgi:peroxidase
LLWPVSQACDASILLEAAAAPGGASEMQAGSNGGVRRLEWIEGVKAAVEAECPGAVSCADVVAMSARDAVALSGGPDVRLPLGRLDATPATMTAAMTAASEMTAAAAAEAALPAANVSVTAALRLFPDMDAAEAVALLGAHTLGVAHCNSFADRLFPARDPTMNFLLANALRARCSLPVSAAASFAALDSTNLRFDSAYFRDLLNGRGLLRIDSALALHPRTQPHVRRFAADPPAFFAAFSSAFVKLTSKVASHGEVRINCRRPNNSSSSSNGR